MRFILLLGSNLGNREERLAEAISAISREIGTLDALSGVYETAPWGNQEQGPFLNQVVSGNCEFSPDQLLVSILMIEKAMGRERTSKWAPRAIDIDILFYGSLVVSKPGLEIPHPMLHERRFTLQPLCDIFPEFRHPVSGKSMQELLAIVPDALEVHPYQPEK